MTIQQAVQNASSAPILSAAHRLQTERFPMNMWLDKGNRYAKETIDRLKADGAKAPTRPNQLAEYMAASVLLHCTDGWTFFSHAIDNLINGDIGTSVFMAYYAQLRAVMSFLASEGIGIFKNKHFWVENNGRYNFFELTTHDAVKNVIEIWANYPPKSNHLLNLMRLENKSFSEWVVAAQISLGSPGVALLAKDWLKAWSLDLNIMSEDHRIRNEASYRPQRIYPYSRNCCLQDYLHHLVEIWRASEPVGSQRFSLLDRHLLRNTLTSIYRNQTGKYPHWRQNTKGYKLFVETAVSNLGLTLDNNLAAFLSDPAPSLNHPVLEEARRKGKSEDGGIRPLPIISRAYLLLRLASAATQELLLNSSVKKEDLFFWWEELGNDIGLWIPEKAPEQMSDLWVDVKSSVDAIEDWYTQNDDLAGILKVKQDLPFDSWQFKQFNRAGLWAIGL